jgi:hypothetical protein
MGGVSEVERPLRVLRRDILICLSLLLKNQGSKKLPPVFLLRVTRLSKAGISLNRCVALVTITHGEIVHHSSRCQSKKTCVLVSFITGLSIAIDRSIDSNDLWVYELRLTTHCALGSGPACSPGLWASPHIGHHT